MATSRDVLAAMAIRIGIDSAGMNSSLNKVSSNMDKFKENLKSFGMQMGLSLAAIGTATLALFKSGFNSYYQQLKAEKLLLTAVKGRKDIQEGLIRQAEYLQKTTLFSDEEIINQQKFIASLGYSEKDIRKITDASIQLATALDIDLASAVKLLTSSYAGNLKELGRYLPELKNFSKEQLAAGAAVDYVNRNMQGLAETAANTDPIYQMKKAWDELKESFGKAIAPAVTKFSQRGSKEFAIWGSDQFSFWQKASQLFNKKRTDELYNMMIAAEASQKAQDDLNASTEKTAETIVDEEEAAKNAADALKKLNEQLDQQLAIRKSLISMSKAVSSELMSTPKDYAAATFMPQAIPGKVGTNLAEDRNGVLQINNAMPTPNFPEQKQRWEENYQMILDYYDKIQVATYEFNMIVERGFEDITASFAEAIGQMMATGERLDFSIILDAFANLATSLGKLLIATGIGGIALKKLMLNPYMAVAAGAALVALGAAARSATNNMISNAGATSSSVSMNTSGSAQSDYSRNFGEGYEPLTVKVDLSIRNDHLAVASSRGQKQIAKY